jgi:tetratricopeptide (TPR) repeat protein
MLVMVRVVMRYIFLLIAPLNLTANHNLVGGFPTTYLIYDKLDPILNQSIFDPEVILAIIVLLSLLGLALTCYKKLPFITFCILWFFITLLPVSYIIPGGGAMAEKYLYIPSFGFLILLAFLAYKFLLPKLGEKILLILFILLCGSYFCLTFDRNKIWYNDITLFADMDKKLPGNLKANFSLGLWYGEEGNDPKAIYYFNKTLLKAPTMWQGYYQLAAIYQKEGKKDLALKEYNKTLELNPAFAPAINALDLLSYQSSEAGSLAKTPLNGNISYSIYPGVSFTYPASFSLIKTDKGVILKDKVSDFTITLESSTMQEGITAQDYLGSQQTLYGILINQGLAKIPNMDFAYVKIWILSNSTQMDQFFLFTNGKVIEVRVSPANSILMKTFDRIILTIKQNEDHR